MVGNGKKEFCLFVEERPRQAGFTFQVGYPDLGGSKCLWKVLETNSCILVIHSLIIFKYGLDLA